MRARDAQFLTIRPVSTDRTMMAALQQLTSMHAPLRAVVRDQSAWDTLWTQAARPQSGQRPPQPSVDFTREMLIAVATGDTPAGTEIYVRGLTTRQDTLVARVVTRSGVMPGCRTDAILAPVHIVRAPRSALPVVFEEHLEDAGCGER